jgi:hypothetical protein
LLNAGAVEIGAQLAEDVIVAGLFKVGHYQ